MCTPADDGSPSPSSSGEVVLKLFMQQITWSKVGNTRHYHHHHHRHQQQQQQQLTGCQFFAGLQTSQYAQRVKSDESEQQAPSTHTYIARNFGDDLSLTLAPSPSDAFSLGTAFVCFVFPLFKKRVAEPPSSAAASPPPVTPAAAAAAFSVMAAAVAAADEPMR
jgi:hypothetical protein